MKTYKEAVQLGTLLVKELNLKQYKQFENWEYSGDEDVDKYLSYEFDFKSLDLLICFNLLKELGRIKNKYNIEKHKLISYGKYIRLIIRVLNENNSKKDN